MEIENEGGRRETEVKGGGERDEGGRDRLTGEIVRDTGGGGEWGREIHQRGKLDRIYIGPKPIQSRLGSHLVHNARIQANLITLWTLHTLHVHTQACRHEYADLLAQKQSSIFPLWFGSHL